ncbi:MAG TPA: type II secretion system protein [Paucimonas sp.]|nr:type II secretion system protein [Paucimonas sp.]
MNTGQRGFTYLGLLILIAVIGVSAAATLQVGAVLQRRAAEDELLAIGEEFRNALISYATATPAGQKRYPNSLEDLLRDPRYPGVRRHLRHIYPDPLTGKEEWGMVRAADGSGIVGFYSLCEGRPIKIGNFAPPFHEFEGKALYRDWLFAIEAVHAKR